MEQKVKKYRLPRKKKKRLRRSFTGILLYRLRRNKDALALLRKIYSNHSREVLQLANSMREQLMIKDNEELLSYPATPDECYEWGIPEELQQ